MVNIPATIKVFLEDNTVNVLTYNEEIYQKVRYSKDLVILYKQDRKFSLSNLCLSMLGIFSLTLDTFVCLVNSYDTDTLLGVNSNPLLNSKEDIEKLTSYYLQRSLTQLIHKELESILELQVKTNTKVSKEMEQNAITYFKANKNPIMDFDDYNVTLDISNLEDFIIDNEDFAFSCANEIYNENPDLLKNYQYFKDVSYALEELRKGNRLDLTLYSIIKDLSQDSLRKTYNIVLTKDGVSEERIDSVPIEEILLYPSYAIKEIYWGRSLLFSLNDYDKKQLDDLRKNVDFNLDALENSKNRYTFLQYVDERLFKDYDFCCGVLEYEPQCYSKIDKSFKENIPFIKKALKKIYVPYIVENVSSDFILDNEDFFLSLLTKEDERIFTSFPKEIKEKDSFILKLIEIDGKFALNIIPETKVFESNIQNAFDEWFKVNPLSPLNFCYDYKEMKLDRLKNPNTILNTLTISNFAKLDKNLIDDFSFINKFLDRIEKYKAKESPTLGLNGFSLIYTNLDKLKTDRTIISKLLKLFILNSSDFRMLDDSLKEDEDIQRLAISNNIELLFLANDNLKEEKVLNLDAKMYLPYTKEKTSSNRRETYDKEWFIKIAKSSIQKPSNLEALSLMSYNQKDDRNLVEELIKINPKSYNFISFDLKEDKDIAKLAISEGISIISMLPNKTKYSKSLFDDKEIMEGCLKINPLDFDDIPKASRQTGPAPLLEDKDFILFAIKLDSYNARFLDMKSPFREDKDIAKTAIFGDIEQAVEFSNKLFKDEEFVYSIMDEVYQYTYNGHLEDIREYILDRVPKKIKNSKEFIAKYPEFKEE